MHVKHKVSHEKMLDHKMMVIFKVNKSNNFVGIICSDGVSRLGLAGYRSL